VVPGTFTHLRLSLVPPDLKTVVYKGWYQVLLLT
jgi:hypothetical protein